MIDRDRHGWSSPPPAAGEAAYTAVETWGFEGAVPVLSSHRFVDNTGSTIICAATGRTATADSTMWEQEPTDLADQVRRGPTPPAIVFVVVGEGKAVKNRLHLDVRPVDRSSEEEVERLIGLGATRVDIGQGPVPWTVLADPEGNEFCVLGPLPA